MLLFDEEILFSINHADADDEVDAFSRWWSFEDEDDNEDED